MFPPGNAPLDEAVRAHREHRAAPYADLVGPLVVGDVHLPDLLDAVVDRRRRTSRTAVVVVVSGGAGALEPAVRWATRDGAPDLRGLEIALRDSATGGRPQRPPDRHRRRPAGRRRRARRRGAGVRRDAPAVRRAARPRTGWPRSTRSRPWTTGSSCAPAAPTPTRSRPPPSSPPASPPPSTARSPFKCTAGLHNAVRHRDPDTGFEHHGFLNVLLATRASLDGAERRATSPPSWTRPTPQTLLGDP